MVDLNTHSLLLEALTENTLKYPRNNCGIQTQEYSAQALEQQLNQREKVLFRSNGAVEFLELRRQEDGYHSRTLCSTPELAQHLRLSIAQHRPDPRQRYIFITAPHSRAPLRISREMLSQILTYHQVMPAFLDFIFPFGKQHYVRDFYFSGFRSQTYIDQPCRGLQIPSLDRSGRHVELCYILKSVEKSNEQPWSIRSCSVHHKFDLDSNQSTWIIVKANKLIRDAVDKELERCHETCQSSQETPHPFSTSLAIHQIISEWAGQSWHWYINHLESSLQEKTRRTLFTPLDPMVISDSSVNSPGEIHIVPKLAQQRRPSFRSFQQQFKRGRPRSTTQDSQATLQANAGHEMQPISPETDARPIVIAMDHFRFEDLQQIQKFEDKVNGILHVLKANSKVLRDISQEYSRLADPVHSKPFLSAECRRDLDRFYRHLDTVDKDLEMQQSRVETLLKIAADRKALIQEILHYRSMQATQDVAMRAQETAENVEDMTRHMHRIARKTVNQTVSMRIITIVTMLFLPGTFVSTLMSTPIVDFDGPSNGFSINNVGIGALKLYLIVSMPLLCLTVLGWFAWYLREKRQETKDAKSQDDNDLA